MAKMKKNKKQNPNSNVNLRNVLKFIVNQYLIIL